jgi:Domain of unknown function (DUF4157)/Protein of unknown function (DUF3626)
MSRTYDNEKKPSQSTFSFKPTASFLQTRPFASIQTDLDEDATPRPSGYTENFLEKIINQRSTNSSDTPVQTKPMNRLKKTLQDKRVSAIQAKLSIGEPNDKYEQEADATASKVVQQINSTPQDQSVQKQESMEEEDEELQMKPISSIQREAAMEEEEELQMKSLVQRRENISGAEASTDLESSIQSARGGGRSLDANLQAKMGQAMGADFSGVKVHTDSLSDQLNKSIQAKAFTTGKDVFFQQGAYNPSSRGGQELIAHELTHVVQQNGGDRVAASIQRKDGLPNDQEALNEAGKAGYKVFGKSTWAKILLALKSFRKIKDDQKNEQLTTLLELQNLTEGWLNSPSRQKVKKNDNSKKLLLAKIRPTIKVLIYEAQNKSKTVDKVNINAAKYAGENRQLIKANLLKNNLASSKKDIDALLASLKSAVLTLNLAPNTLEFLVGSPDFKTIWQIAYKDKSPGGTLPEVDKLGGSNQREDAERYLGYDPFTESQRENRPAYCGINILKNPKGAAPTYGRFFFEFQESVKSRATYTAFDTFAMRKDNGIRDVPAEKAIASTDNMEALLAHNEGVLKVLSNLLAGTTMTEQYVKNAMGKYIEAQIHGGLSVNDVSALVVDYPQDVNKQDVMQKADAVFVDKFAKKYPSITIKYSS